MVSCQSETERAAEFNVTSKLLSRSVEMMEMLWSENRKRIHRKQTSHDDEETETLKFKFIHAAVLHTKI